MPERTKHCMSMELPVMACLPVMTSSVPCSSSLMSPAAHACNNTNQTLLQKSFEENSSTCTHTRQSHFHLVALLTVDNVHLHLESIVGSTLLQLYGKRGRAGHVNTCGWLRPRTEAKGVWSTFRVGLAKFGPAEARFA